MDFPDLTSYNNELHQIVAKLRLCGENITNPELIDKTLTSFPSASITLGQQYHNMKFKTHSELMTYLFFAEKQQEISMKVVESKPVKEVHATEISVRKPWGGGKSQEANRPFKHKDKSYSSRSSNSRSKCHKCSRLGHFQRDCRTGECKKCGKASHLSQDCTSNSKSAKCQKCGKIGHVSKDFCANDHMVTIYAELKKLHKSHRESHSLNAPALDGTDHENYMTIDDGYYRTHGTDPENYMAVADDQTHLTPLVYMAVEDEYYRIPPTPGIDCGAASHQDMALLDSMSTHTILKDLKYFDFSGHESEAWQTGGLNTIARR